MKKNFSGRLIVIIKKSLVLFLLSPIIILAQNVGIGTTSPVATLDIISRTNLSSNKSLLVLNSDKEMIMSGLENGDIGFGKTAQLPLAQVTIFGVNNKNLTSVPAFSVSYASNPQKWGIYINPKQGDINPSLPGYFNFYMDNDGNPSTYYTSGIGYGSFFGMHTIGVNSGLFLSENGTTVFNQYHPENLTGGYLTTNPIALLINGSVRIEDENKGYAENGTCINPGTIAFDAANNSFLGCVEIYDIAGNNTGTKIWKKLNNN